MGKSRRKQMYQISPKFITTVDFRPLVLWFSLPSQSLSALQCISKAAFNVNVTIFILKFGIFDTDTVLSYIFCGFAVKYRSVYRQRIRKSTPPDHSSSQASARIGSRYGVCWRSLSFCKVTSWIFFILQLYRKERLCQEEKPLLPFDIALAWARIQTSIDNCIFLCYNSIDVVFST